MADPALQDWLRTMDDQIMKEEQELQALQGSLNGSFSTPLFIPKVSLPTPAVQVEPDEEKVESDLGDTQEPGTVAERIKALKDGKKAEIDRIQRSANGQVPVEDRLLQQASTYQRNKEMLKKQIQDQETEAARPLGIDKHSEHLVQHIRGRGGPIEERLIKTGLRVNQEKQESAIREEIEARKNAKPALSPLANRLERNEDVSERLIQFQKVYQDNLLQLKKKTEEQCSFRPQINHREEIRLETKETGRKSPICRPEEHPFKPTLSKKSLQIAARLGKARERLIASKSKETLIEEEPSFRPVINKRSELLDHRTHAPGGKSSRWAVLYDLSKEPRDSKPSPDLSNKSEEDKECTFRPKIIGTGDVSQSSGDVVQRLLEWSRVKDFKVQQAKESNADKDLTECTFMPQLNELKSTENPDPGYSKGVDKFLERHRLARRRKMEKEEPVLSRSKSEISRAMGKQGKSQETAIEDSDQYLNEGDQSPGEISSMEFVDAVRALHVQLQEI